VINPDMSIHVVDVPKTKEETAAERVSRIMFKGGGHLRELAKFISETGETGLTRKQILADLCTASTASWSPTRWLTLQQIETFAKQFCGFTAALERKFAKDQKQAEFFAKTKTQLRALQNKSRVNKQTKEIERISEFWGPPEIMQAKSVKHARLL